MTEVDVERGQDHTLDQVLPKTYLVFLHPLDHRHLTRSVHLNPDKAVHFRAQMASCLTPVQESQLTLHCGYSNGSVEFPALAHQWRRYPTLHPSKVVDWVDSVRAQDQ